MRILDRIFKKRSSNVNTAEASSEEIVSSFGQVLATSAPRPGCVADESELPYPKPAIKKAILCLLPTATQPKLREHLIFAYISLADWQTGVGQEHIGIPDLSPENRKKDLLELANQIISNGEKYKQWEPIVKAEQQLLLAELQRLGY